MSDVNTHWVAAMVAVSAGQLSVKVLQGALFTPANGLTEDDEAMVKKQAFPNLDPGEVPADFVLYRPADWQGVDLEKRIDELTAERDRLRAALEEIVQDGPSGWEAAQIAREAMAKGEPG